MEQDAQNSMVSRLMDTFAGKHIGFQKEVIGNILFLFTDCQVTNKTTASFPKLENKLNLPTEAPLHGVFFFFIGKLSSTLAPKVCGSGRLVNHFIHSTCVLKKRFYVGKKEIYIIYTRARVHINLYINRITYIKRKYLFK